MEKPSISKLLQLLDKPALLNWANRQGLKGIDISQERYKWLNAGTSIHKQIELYHLEKKPFEDENLQKKYIDYIKDKSIIELEKHIETDYFKGRLDCTLNYKNKKFIIDYKTTKKNNVYFENRLQLVAYGMAEQCDSFAIVAMPNFIFIQVYIEDRKPYEEIIKSLSNIYYQKQQIENLCSSPLFTM